MPEIEIIISPDGEISIEAKGYTGGKCLEATKPYEKALGVTIERKKKPEFFSESEVLLRGKTGIRNHS